jgi:DNA recombination-dependent growth factor C
VLQEEAESGDDALSVMYASQVIQTAELGEIIDELAMLMGGWQD